MSAPLQLQVSEPFEIDCQKSANGRTKRIDEDCIEKFWQDRASAFAGKKGCYVFVLKASKGYKPWYVGKTHKQDFCKECFGHFQLGKYDKLLFDRKGKPMLFFVAAKGAKNILPAKVISELELFLIQQGKFVNPDMLNTVNAKLPEWGISGVLRSGKGNKSDAARSFSTMMDIS